MASFCSSSYNHLPSSPIKIGTSSSLSPLSALRTPWMRAFLRISSGDSRSALDIIRMHCICIVPGCQSIPRASLSAAAVSPFMALMTSDNRGSGRGNANWIDCNNSRVCDLMISESRTKSAITFFNCNSGLARTELILEICRLISGNRRS